MIGLCATTAEAQLFAGAKHRDPRRGVPAELVLENSCCFGARLASVIVHATSFASRRAT